MLTVNATSWGQTPRQSIDAECGARGRDAVVAGCIALLERRDADPDLILALAGPAALPVLRDGSAGGSDYWLRVWAARGLLWAWDDSAQPAILAALTDEAWRVREMATKVVARNGVGDALPFVTNLLGDPVARVRAAASRAIVRLTTTRA
jgi:HEAT repeat protein